MAVVYQHRRLDTGDIFYIGIGKTLKRAYSKHGRSKPWRDLTRYRKWEVEILFENLEWNSACEKERELIKLYGRRDLNEGSLVNMTDGGDGVENPSEEVRKKNGDAHRGLVGWNKGLTKETDERIRAYAEKLKNKVRSKEHCENISKSKKGKPLLHFLGDKNPAKRPDVREKNRLAKLGNTYRRGKNHNEETKVKIAASRKGRFKFENHPRSKPVRQLDKKSFRLINVYSCAKEACAKTGIDWANIRGCCVGRLKSAGGYIWQEITKDEYSKIKHR